jgi:hypothetical protein
MSQLFEMDGEYDVLPLILDYDSPTKAPRPNDTII